MRVLKRVPRRDLDQLILRAFLSTGSVTIACNMHIVHVVYYIIFQTDEKKTFGKILFQYNYKLMFYYFDISKT